MGTQPSKEPVEERLAPNTMHQGVAATKTEDGPGEIVLRQEFEVAVLKLVL